jgi:hypothetical protein
LNEKYILNKIKTLSERARAEKEAAPLIYRIMPGRFKF